MFRMVVIEMAPVRRFAFLAACCALFAAGTAVVSAALACLPCTEWLVRGAVFVQAPAAALSLPLPAESAAPAAATPQDAVSVPAAPTPAPTAAPDAAPSPSPSPAPSETPEPSTAPALTNPGTIRAETFTHGSGSGYVTLAAGSIRNMTENADSDLRAAATTENLPFDIEINSDEPQILILHTHATETYQTWSDLVFDRDFTARTKNTALNMCVVGDAMTDILNAAGICTVHDTTLYDSPSYTESYDRSRAAAKEYLAKYPSIKIILDVHRDAIEDADGTRVKPLCQIDGEDTAQVMIIAGCDNGGTVSLPNWRLNLRFAAAWEQSMESLYPTLTRPVLCGYRFYNQDLTTGSLLIEIGGHANTVAEAVRAGEYAARALAALLGGAETQPA